MEKEENEAFEAQEAQAEGEISASREFVSQGMKASKVWRGGAIMASSRDHGWLVVGLS